MQGSVPARDGRRAGSGAGFALLEVLAALLLLTFGLLGVASALVAALRAQHAAGASLAALGAAADAGEHLRAVPPAARIEAALAWTASARERLAALPGRPFTEDPSLAPEALPGEDGEPWRLRLVWRDRLGGEPRRLEFRLVAQGTP